MAKSRSRRKNKPAARKRTPLTPLPVPKFAPIKGWCALSGMGRTTTYQHIAAKHLRTKKLGRLTLVDVEAGLLYLESLPAAEVTLPNSRTIPPAE